MNRQSTTKLSAAMLLAAAAATMASDAGATPFGSDGFSAKQLFCVMPNLQASFTAQTASYSAAGTCAQMSSPIPVNNDQNGKSEFPDTNQSTELFRAAWTAVGTYNAATKETTETVTLPAPKLDEPSPPGRPYGRFASKMICATDPWLDASAQCTAMTSTATGNLGDMAAALRTKLRPLTSQATPAQHQALIDQHQRIAQIAAAAVSTQISDKPSFRYTKPPEVIYPSANSAQRPQTPMLIRVAAPVGVGKVQSYTLHIEQKGTGGAWQPVTTVPVPAAEIEGVFGYKGWGGHQAGTPANMTATLGTWRLQVVATAQQPVGPSPWREFTVAGTPGPSPDTLRPTSIGSIKAVAPESKTGVKLDATTTKPSTGLDWSKAAPSSISH